MDVRLKNTEKAEITALVQQFGLNEDDFKWTEEDSTECVSIEAVRFKISVLTHNPTNYYCKFAGYCTEYSPGPKERVQRERHHSNWAEKRNAAKLWLDELKKELEIPDPGLAENGDGADSGLSEQARVRRQILEQVHAAKAMTRYIPVFSLPVAVHWDKDFITGQLQILEHEGRVDLKIDPAGQAGMVKLTALGLRSLEQAETAFRPHAAARTPNPGSPSVEPQRAIELLKRQHQVDIELLPFDDPQIGKWWNLTSRIVEESFGRGRNYSHFVAVVSHAGGSRQERQVEHAATIRSKKALLESFIEQLELLQPKATASVPLLRIEREGVFFAGQNFDALLRTSKIIAGAKASIQIVDGYVGEDLLNLLTAKENGVTVSVLTKPLSPSLITLCRAFNQQYGNLSVRSSTAFHDRFVIVDDADFFHFGASLKDLGKRGFMFSRIEEPDVIDALRKKFRDEWSTGKVEI